MLLENRMAAVCHAAFQSLPAVIPSSRFCLIRKQKPRSRKLFPLRRGNRWNNPWNGRIAEARVATVHPSDRLQGYSGGGEEEVAGRGRDRGRKRSRDLKKSPEYLVGIDPWWKESGAFNMHHLHEVASQQSLVPGSSSTVTTVAPNSLFSRVFFLLLLFFAGWNFRFQIIWTKQPNMIQNVFWRERCPFAVTVAFVYSEGSQPSRSSSSRRVELGQEQVQLPKLNPSTAFI